MEKLVSIITPYQNSSVFFKKTFDSVVNQTYKNWEWIIVDDFSSDDEAKALDELVKQDKRIKVIRNKTNRGPAFSRNIGLKNAIGEFVAFLDSDDYWSIDKLEKQISFMLKNKYDFTSTFYKIYDEKKKRITFYVKGPKKCSHKTFIRLDYVGCLTVIFRRSISPDLCIPEDIKKRNDYALWLKLSEESPCYMLPEFLATYTKHSENSVSAGSKFQLIKYHRDVFMKLYGFRKFKANLYAFRNVFYYVFKELFYKKKYKETR